MLASFPSTVTVPAGSQRVVSLSGIHPTVNPALVTITASLLNSSQVGYLTDLVTHVVDRRWAWLLALRWPWY
jgi:hypothetical protein